VAYLRLFSKLPLVLGVLPPHQKRKAEPGPNRDAGYAGPELRLSLADVNGGALNGPAVVNILTRAIPLQTLGVVPKNCLSALRSKQLGLTILELDGFTVGFFCIC